MGKRLPWGYAAAAIGGALISSQGAQSAANTQAGAQEQAANTQAGMYYNTVQQEQPYLQAGYGAQGELNYLLGIPSTGGPSAGSGISDLAKYNSSFANARQHGAQSIAVPGLSAGYLLQPFNPTMQQLQNYPGYQFQLQQGDLAIQNENSAGGSALSGATLKDLMSYNQGLAASNYQNYFNQYQQQQTNIYNRLSNIASLGQNAAGNLGSTGAQLGTGIAGAQAAAGGSLAAGQVGAANAYSGALQSIPMYMMMNNFMNQGGGGGGGTAYPPQ